MEKDVEIRAITRSLEAAMVEAASQSTKTASPSSSRERLADQIAQLTRRPEVTFVTVDLEREEVRYTTHTRTHSKIA